MRDHIGAFEHGAVFDIDAIFNENKVKDPVFVDIIVQHDEKLIPSLSGMIDAHRHVRVFTCRHINEPGHHIAIGPAIDDGMQDEPTIIFDNHFREGQPRLNAPGRSLPHCHPREPQKKRWDLQTRKARPS